MTREEARAVWDASRLTYAHLTLANVQNLRDQIGTKMKASGLMAPSSRSAGTYRIQSKIKVWLQHGGFGCGLYCKAFYFKDREAVTFNDNGFIGFAGWADEVNVQPILSGFVDWVGELSKMAAPPSNTHLSAAMPDLLESAREIIPHGLALDNRNIPDDAVVPIDLTMGELRRVASAIVRAEAAHG